MSQGEYTPLAVEWFNPPIRIGDHEPEPRYTPLGMVIAGCKCGWRSRRYTRDFMRSWADHLRKAQQ